MKPFFILLCALFVGGCEIDRYTVVLAVDAKDYRAAMKWTEIREAADHEPYGMHVEDAAGHAIPLFRFMHESRSLMPLDENPIQISTPIIIEKKYATFFVRIIDDHSKELKRLRVDVRDLHAVQGGPAARVFPVNLQ